ncbi:MAG: (4Fe-4S)-binding protein, partial [Bacteroidetes bacterium]|nr:(4Fe-4S)-binding protein [Bacteroidota bacterium]
IFEQGDFSLYDKVAAAEPSIRLCISCGTCASGCTSAQYVDFSLRRIIVLLQRGLLADVRKEISCCMLCGKCILACPRGINTRNLVLVLRKQLDEKADVLS